MRINGNVDVPDQAIEAFCRKWKITRIEAFGSALRDDFGPESDVDLLVSFEEAAHHSLKDLVSMEREIAEIIGRSVDLVERKGVEASKNYIRRKSILESAKPLYERA